MITYMHVQKLIENIITGKSAISSSNFAASIFKLLFIHPSCWKSHIRPEQKCYDVQYSVLGNFAKMQQTS